jgi:predicted ArsR family transcriptional regulator
MPLSLKQIKNNLLAEYIEELERTVEELAAELAIVRSETVDDLAQRLGINGVTPRKH